MNKMNLNNIATTITTKEDKVTKLLSIIAGNKKEEYNDTIITEAIRKGYNADITKDIDLHNIDSENLWYSTEVMLN